MDEEKIEKAGRVCRYYLMTCSKQELVNFIMENLNPGKLEKVAERLMKEIKL